MTFSRIKFRLGILLALDIVQALLWLSIIIWLMVCNPVHLLSSHSLRHTSPLHDALLNPRSHLPSQRIDYSFAPWMIPMEVILVLECILIFFLTASITSQSPAPTKALVTLFFIFTVLSSIYVVIPVAWSAFALGSIKYASSLSPPITSLTRRLFNYLFFLSIF